MKKFGITLLGLLVLTGCGTQEAKDSKSSKAESSTTIVSTTAESSRIVEESASIDSAPANQFKVGDSVRYSTGHEITVKSISKTDEEPNMTETIQGNFVRVDFSFKNGESEPITFSGPLLQLFNSDGSEAKMSSKGFLFQEIAPGETANMSAYFDAGEGPYKVVFSKETSFEE